MGNTAEIAVFGGGCFWCTEAVFAELQGVVSVMPGYAGGSTRNPTYAEVCNEGTGHAEVVKVEFDPQRITYRDLLKVFFATHDPTTPNRQGVDVGTQYRSIILYGSAEQRREAEAFMAELNAESRNSGDPVVTELKPLGVFYEAEESHRRYSKRHSSAVYCQLVINPKLAKLRQQFARHVR